MYITGFRLALAPYIAAVSPAGPEPMMTRFSSESMTPKIALKGVINICGTGGD